MSLLNTRPLYIQIYAIMEAALSFSYYFLEYYFDTGLRAEQQKSLLKIGPHSEFSPCVGFPHTI